MKISFARSVDRYVGIPLCFLFLLALKSSRFFYKGDPKTPEKIVFLGLTEIGAGIMAYPAIQKMRSFWKDADIYLWVFKDNADFFNATGWFQPDHVIAMRSDSFLHLAIDAIKNLNKIRKIGIDTMVDLEASTRFSSLLCFLSGARTRVGFYSKIPKSLYRGYLYTHQAPFDPAQHISKNFCLLVDALLHSAGVAQRNEPSEALSLSKIKTSPEEDEHLRHMLRDLGGDAILHRRWMLIHMGLNDRLPMRRWPPESYWKLIDRLLEHPDVAIILVGTGPRHSFYQSETRSRVIQLIGQTNTRELFSLLKMATLLISHDSGIVHIAALTGTPVIALFGPETPDVFGPLSDRKNIIYKKFPCSPCLLISNYKQTSCQDNQCMRAISVEEVYAEALKVLS
ncbi:MAG: glycosyltransferase family 9 protein [Candidatus Omnitrophota bacterium]